MTETQPPTACATTVHSPAIRIVRIMAILSLVGLTVWQGYEAFQAQERLNITNERLFRIVHGSPVAIIMCDDREHVVEFSKAAEDLFGWKREEMLGKNVNVLIAESSRAKHDEVFRKSVADLRSIDEDWKIGKEGLKGIAVDREGREIHINFSTQGIRYRDKIEFLAFIRRDWKGPKTDAGPLVLPKKSP